MCHDDDFFYLTQRDYLWKIPRTLKIESIKKNNKLQIRKVGIPEELKKLGSDHLGDCDYFDKKIFIPLEGTPIPRVIIFNAETLEFIAAPKISTGQFDAPWITVDSRDGTLIVGPFNITPESPLYRLRFDEESKTLENLETIRPTDNNKPLTIKRVQGVDISVSKNLVIFVSDLKKGGMFGFDLNDFSFKFQQKIKYRPGFPVYEELEGIDILEDDESFPQYRGNLFIPILNNNLLFNDFANLKSFLLQ